jgi:transcriptional regulator with XRE-family HTH domain
VLMDQPVSFGYWVRRRRKALDLTQAALAAQVGCVVVTIKKIEQDVRRPSRLLAERIADALGLDAAERAGFLQAARAMHMTAQLPAPVERPLATSAPILSSEPPPLPSLRGRYHPLPIPATPLIGREAEVLKVSALLVQARVRLLTLTGPGGIGKTRLGLHVATKLTESYRDGVVFVALASISDPSEVSAAIARALGIREHDGLTLTEQLQAALAPRQLLLVLDNFEHVVATAPVIGAILAAAPDVQALVPSPMSACAAPQRSPSAVKSAWLRRSASQAAA